MFNLIEWLASLKPSTKKLSPEKLEAWKKALREWEQDD